MKRWREPGGTVLRCGLPLDETGSARLPLHPKRTIVGLRGMFRTIGGALGISTITLILHLSTNLARVFTIAFISFGVALLVAMPLAFLMPSGIRRD